LRRIKNDNDCLREGGGFSSGRKKDNQYPKAGEILDKKGGIFIRAEAQRPLKKKEKPGGKGKPRM